MRNHWHRLAAIAVIGMAAFSATAADSRRMAAGLSKLL